MHRKTDNVDNVMTLHCFQDIVSFCPESLLYIWCSFKFQQDLWLQETKDSRLYCHIVWYNSDLWQTHDHSRYWASIAHVVKIKQLLSLRQQVIPVHLSRYPSCWFLSKSVLLGLCLDNRHHTQCAVDICGPRMPSATSSKHPHYH